MADTDDDGARRVPDPKEQEDQWKAAMFAVAIVGGVLLGFVLWRYVFQGGTTEEIGRRMTIMVPIGTLYIAAVTFLMTYWRGLITTRQADQQLSQIDGIKRQIKIQSEANLADLLQKGAEILSSTEASKAPAGIAALEAAGASDSQRYAIPAMNLLATYVEDHYAQRSQPHVKQAIAGLRHAHDANGWHATAWITVVIGDGDQLGINLHTPVIGVETVTYQGGLLMHFERYPTASARSMFFNVSLILSSINAKGKNYLFQDCQFSKCNFHEFDDRFFLNSNFTECDFSDCVVINSDRKNIDVLRDGKNFYRAGHPPVGADGAPVEAVCDALIEKRNSANQARD